MNRWYGWAFAPLVLGIGAIVWSILAGTQPPPATLFVAAAAAPLAVLLGVLGRMEGRLPTPALIGGAILGPVVAIVGHAVVFGFAAAFLLGFLEAGRALLEELRVDPRNHRDPGLAVVAPSPSGSVGGGPPDRGDGEGAGGEAGLSGQPT